MTVVLLFALLSFMSAVVLAGSATIAARRQLRASLGRASAYASSEPIVVAAPRSVGTPRVLLPFVPIPLRVRRRVGVDVVAKRIAAAGLARRMTPETYLGIQGAVLALGVVVAIGSAVGGSSPSRVFSLCMAIVVAGLLLPDYLLKKRAETRSNEIQVALPNALDLLAVSVEGGLGLDAAMARVADSLAGPLTEELNATLAEIRVGEARSVALQRLAERVDRPEMTSFVRSVSRADQLGVSLAETLRIQAAEARLRRQTAAEEQAAKAPVKMLLPTAIFIFPALFVIVLGPAAMSILSLF